LIVLFQSQCVPSGKRSHGILGCPGTRNNPDVE
jgi:hypothetical protein